MRPIAVIFLQPLVHEFPLMMEVGGKAAPLDALALDRPNDPFDIGFILRCLGSSKVLGRRSRLEGFLELAEILAAMIGEDGLGRNMECLASFLPGNHRLLGSDCRRNMDSCLSRHPVNRDKGIALGP